MNEVLMRTIHFIFETLLVVWFYGRTPTLRENKKYLIPALCCLLLQMPSYYLESGVFLSVARFAGRTVCYSAYLRLYKGLSWPSSIYDAGLLALFFTIANNVWLSPVFYQIRIAPPQIFSNPSWNAFLIQCVGRYLVVWAVLLIPRYLVRFYEIPVLRPSRAFMLFLLTFIELYVRETVYFINTTGGTEYYQITVYLFILHIFLLLFAILQEHIFYENEQRTKLLLQETTNAFRLRSMKLHQSGEQDIRRMHHDMKNHLLTIDRLAAQGSNDQIRRYIQTLGGQMSNFETAYATGSDLLDGILAEKQAEAAAEKIDFSVDLRLPGSLKLEDTDLCTIFGNLVDNAIEACQHVTQPEKRYLLIKGREHAQRYFLTFQNSYQPTGKLILSGGLPVTTKQNAYAHGFGLTNVKRAVAHYSGTLSVDSSEDGCFKIILSFPI